MLSIKRETRAVFTWRGEVFDTPEAAQEAARRYFAHELVLRHGKVQRDEALLEALVDEFARKAPGAFYDLAAEFMGWETVGGDAPRPVEVYAQVSAPAEDSGADAAVRGAPRRDPAVGLFAAEVEAEVARARLKFPGDNVTFAALVEEVGEAATALFEQGRADVRAEAIQVAAMACRLALDGDVTFNAWREARGLDALSPPNA